METKTEIKPKDEQFCHHPLTLMLRLLLFLSCYRATVNMIFDHYRGIIVQASVDNQRTVVQLREDLLTLILQVLCEDLLVCAS